MKKIITELKFQFKTKRLNTKFFSYFLGFFIADGNFYETTQNRGRVSIELNIRDLDILIKFNKILKSTISYRTRNTNFKNHYKTAIFKIYNLKFRQYLKSLNIFPGKKCETIKKPKYPFLNHIEYIRGLIDGDGSLGFTKTNIPFISFVSKNEFIADDYIMFLEKYLGIKKIINNNKRDNIKNIVVTRKDAVKLANILYYKNCLSLNRKYIIANKIKNWKSLTKQIIRRTWTKEEDNILLNNSVKLSMNLLKRTERSIRMRKYRLTPIINIKGD